MRTIKMKRRLAALAAAVLMLSFGIAFAEESAQMALEDAKAIALEKAGMDEIAVFMAKLAEDREDGRRVFEIEFIAEGREYAFDIDAETGEIVKESSKTVSSRKNEMVSGGKLLTIDEAMEKALSHADIAAQDAVFSEIEFDYDDGHAEYEIKFTADGRTYKIELNAETGEIIEYEMKSSGGKK